MRLFFITEDDPIYVYNFFEVFLQEYPQDKFIIAGVTIQKAFNEALLSTAKRLLGFYGWVDFIRLLGRYTREKCTQRTISKLFAQKGIPQYPTASVNQKEYVQQLATLSLDVIISVAAPEIFRKSLLRVPQMVCLNIHSGRLPAYRGMMPVFWQMRNGEKEITVTIHEMVPKLDAGRILATAKWALLPGDSLDRVIRETKKLGARLMIRTLLAMREGEELYEAQKEQDSGYFTFPTRMDVRAFRELGYKLL